MRIKIYLCVRNLRRSEVITFLEQPIHLACSNLFAFVGTHQGVTLVVLGLVEVFLAVRTIVPSALAISDSFCLTFKSLTDCTTCNCRPTEQTLTSRSML